MHDLEDKKHTLIGKIHSLRQELSDQEPLVYMKLIRIYLLHLYGGTLWDIFSNGAVQLWTMWHITIKSIYNLPLPTHKYLLNDLVGVDHLMKLLIRRFVKFTDVISSSQNPHIQLLHSVQYRDWRSTYGRNYMNILREAKVNEISQVDFDNIKINPVPNGEEWRLPLLKDLLAERDCNTGVLTAREVQIMIDEVCNN